MSFFLLPSFLSKKRKIDQALRHLIDSLEDDTSLKKAVEYSFFNGGKRIRPIIVLMLEQALNCPYSLIDAALSIELFHTASLIADDLPMMDNDSIRRDRPSTHIQFGDTTALLASYALIAYSFEKIYDAGKAIELFDPNLESIANKVCAKALKVASFAAGIKGATLGQFFDLFPNKECSIDKLIYLKTVTLFEVTFLFGWLFGGGDFDKIDLVKKLSYHFGMAYQLADDFQDLEEDVAKGKISNYIHAYGHNKSMEIFETHISEIRKILIELKLDSYEFNSLVDFIEKYAAMNTPSVK